MEIQDLEAVAESAMALGSDYEMQDCPIARALELLGERWTFLVIRDCFLGVSRFNDFVDHLDVPKGVLTVRLQKLVAAGIVRKRRYAARQHNYLLTERGLSLWPILYSMAAWGDQHLAPSGGRRRIFSHVICDSDMTSQGTCPTCNTLIPPAEVVIRPGPGAELEVRNDPVTRALDLPHRMLTPIVLDP